MKLRISTLPQAPRGRRSKRGMRREGPRGGEQGWALPGRLPFMGILSRREPLIPAGPARETIEEWVNQGLHVEIYLKMQGLEKDSPPGVWMIRVGNRELSVEEYLLLFDDFDEEK